MASRWPSTSSSIAAAPPRWRFVRVPGDPSRRFCSTWRKSAVTPEPCRWLESARVVAWDPPRRPANLLDLCVNGGAAATSSAMRAGIVSLFWEMSRSRSKTHNRDSPPRRCAARAAATGGLLDGRYRVVMQFVRVGGKIAPQPAAFIAGQSFRYSSAGFGSALRPALAKVEQIVFQPCASSCSGRLRTLGSIKLRCTKAMISGAWSASSSHSGMVFT